MLKIRLKINNNLMFYQDRTPSVSKNKTIGIIGGVGPQASNYLYGKIMEFAVKKYQAKNNDDFPQLILYSLPIPDFITNKNNIALAMKMFKKAIGDFNTLKVDCLTVPATLFIYF